MVELKKLKHFDSEKMSNLVSSVLSRHGQPDSFAYRIILADGSMHVKTEVEARCMVRGDIAIESYNPHLPIENERAEPVCINTGPRQGDVLLVRIDGCRAACKVLEVGQKRGRPLYTVEYDDGMLVQDHLVVPWNYLSTAPVPPDAPAEYDAAAVASHSSSVAPPMSEKAAGKRRAVVLRRAGVLRRVMDVIAEAAESMQTPPQVETAAPNGDVLDEATAANNKVKADLEDSNRKHSEARELRDEREYGELLDSIIL